MFKLADLRKTTRRSNSDGLRTVHPRLLRDRSLAPRIDMAVRYLESMRGHARRELDQEVIVQLFGDHKLARCVIACLATTYRHRARTFAEVLSPEQCAALASQGIVGPSELRLWLFRRVNQQLAGFVGASNRLAFLGEAGTALGIPAKLFDTLIGLDAPENAILIRIGPKPDADDVIARFNYETVAALIGNASVVRVALQRTPQNAAVLRELCAQADVTAELAGRELVLQGRQDAMGGWARQGARLVRLLATLLACGLPARSGEALVAAPDGSQWRFRLDADALADLGCTPDAAIYDDADAAPHRDGWRRSEALAGDFAALRRAGGTNGWTLRRASEPLVARGAVVPALFYCARGNQRVPLVSAPTTAAGRERLQALAQRLPLVALDTGDEPSANGGSAHPNSLLVLSYTQRSDVAALPELLARAVGEVEERTGVARVEAVIEEARACGVLTEPQLAERLGCGEDDVWAQLALPAARVARQARDIQYIEGFGLCTPDVLSRAREAASDVAASESGQTGGATHKVHLLGRRLREVTGAREGIECLIAYLGAA